MGICKYPTLAGGVLRGVYGMDILSLGSVGIGLVWGWLLCQIFRGGSRNRRAINLFALAGATAFLVLQTHLLAGRSAVPWLLAAVVFSLAAHVLFREQLVKRIVSP